MQKDRWINLTWIVLGVFSLVGNVGLSQARPVEAVASANEICPLNVGSTVPSISLRTAKSKAFDLNAALGKKPSVVIFYRGGW